MILNFDRLMIAFPGVALALFVVHAPLSAGDDEMFSIVHEQGLPGQTRPHSGFIDPREDVDADLVPNGIQECFIRFNREALSCDGNKSEVSIDDFFLLETGGGTPPIVTSVEYVDGDKTYVRVTWDRPITMKEWTTVVADVCDSDGKSLPNMSDLGSGVDEPDRVDLGHVSCDTDQSGNASPLDLFRFRQFVNTPDMQPSQGVREDYLDMNRDSAITPIDLYRFRQLKAGVQTTQPWSGAQLHNSRP